MFEPLRYGLFLNGLLLIIAALLYGNTAVIFPVELETLATAIISSYWLIVIGVFVLILMWSLYALAQPTKTGTMYENKRL